MQAVARSVSMEDAPSAVANMATPGQVFITVGKKYEVHGLASFEEQIVFQVIDDIRHPAWLPAWLFDVVDSTLPEDWVCSIFHDAPNLVAGPPFLAESQDSYAKMVELDADSVELFWKRVDSLVEGSTSDDCSG